MTLRTPRDSMRKLDGLHSPIENWVLCVPVTLVLLERIGIALVTFFNLWTLNAAAFLWLWREAHKTKGSTEMEEPQGTSVHVARRAMKRVLFFPPSLLPPAISL